jgi:hypothetical protein
MKPKQIETIDRKKRALPICLLQAIKINPDRQARPAQNMRYRMMLTTMPCMNNIRDNKVACRH